MLLNLPNLDGAARSGCTRLPLSFFFLLFLLLVAMRLDGEEHGRAQYGQLERNKDDGNPIHDFLKTLHGSLDDGSSRVVNEGSSSAWHAGDRVKIVSGEIQAHP